MHIDIQLRSYHIKEWERQKRTVHQRSRNVAGGCVRDK